jgi:hypothetical protein
MPSSKTKINLVSPNLNISDIESKFQNKGTSEISVLDEFLLEIFIDFLNNEKTQYDIFEFHPRLLKFIASRVGSKIKNALRAKKSKSDKKIKRKINQTQDLPNDESVIDNKKKVNVAIAPQIEGSSPRSVVEPSNRPTKLFTPGGKATAFNNQDKNFIIDSVKLDNLTMIHKSEEVIVNLVIEQLKNLQDKLKSKEVVFKTIDDVVDLTKGKLKNLQISNENNVVKFENKSLNFENKVEKFERKAEKLEGLENDARKIVNQNVMNDNSNNFNDKNNVIKEELPSTSPKLVHVRVSFNANNLKSLTDTLFENVSKWQNQVKNHRSENRKVFNKEVENQSICV